MAASILTEETVPEYLSRHVKEIGVFAPDAKLSCKSILGGNVNYAFRIVDEDDETKSVFLKQAPEFVAIFGPDGLPLTSERMNQEIAAYDEWRDILGSETKFLPKIYFFDTKMMVTVMEFLEGFTLLDHDLVDHGIVSNRIAENLGTFMGKTHAATHSSKIPKERVETFTKSFENRAMRDIQLEYVFTKCYNEATDDQKAGLTVDEAFMKEVNDLKAAYDGRGDATNLCLNHGDLHPGSVMIHEDEMRVIDPEFTVYGPPGLDVGSLLSGYVLAAVHQVYSKNSKAVESIVKGAESIWSSYKKEMLAAGITEDMVKKIEIETVGFTVAEVCRTALEFAGGRKWLQFEDADVKFNARKAALGIVSNCMIGRHEGGIALMLDEMKKIV
jgi:5-methylthioribose kinase